MDHPVCINKKLKKIYNFYNLKSNSIWLNIKLSQKFIYFFKKKICTKVSAPNNFFMIDLYLDASVRRLFKQKYSPTDLMHSPISKSDHSALGTYRVPLGDAHLGTLEANFFVSWVILKISKPTKYYIWWICNFFDQVDLFGTPSHPRVPIVYPQPDAYLDAQWAKFFVSWAILNISIDL